MCAQLSRESVQRLSVRTILVGAEMDLAALSRWLQSIGGSERPAACKELLTAELEPLWRFVGALETPMAASSETSNPNDVEGNGSPAEGAALLIRQSVQGLPTQRASYLGERTSRFTELAATAHLSRLQHLGRALQYYKEELLQRLDEARGIRTGLPTASLPPALQTQSTAVLAHVAADLKSQVSRVLAGGSLGRAQIDWPAVSKAFTEQSTAEAAAVFSPQLFSTAVLEACTEQERSALETVNNVERNNHPRKSARQLCNDAFQANGCEVPSPDMLLHASRKEHVQLFFATQQAAEAQQQASEKLGKLVETLQRLCGGSSTGELRKQLLTLLADNAGNRAAVHLLEMQMAELTKRRDHLEKVCATVLSLKDALVSGRMRNLMLDYVIHDLVCNGTGFLERWMPNSDALKAATSTRMADNYKLFSGGFGELPSKLSSEDKALMQVHSPGWRPAPDAGDIAAQLKWAAKKQFAWLGSLSKGIQLLTQAVSAEQQQVVEKLASIYNDYKLLIDHEVESLNSQVDEASLATEHVSSRTPRILECWWEQPALDAVPWIESGGRNAKGWLGHIQALHAAAASRTGLA